MPRKLKKNSRVELSIALKFENLFLICWFFGLADKTLCLNHFLILFKKYNLQPDIPANKPFIE
ncbi:hypothetical protein MuYL_4086 [Mucilaginibacter xinganensis]|uniref:Uncharacterized protein n=1 Tax=Mucilaginibacter xinganensis TaxID=1234841 RepID=A0A223P2B8_9SPHI|nr:hypothetical protein MuYL_4086 [Mucilaginibacter xinganensis]